ncbi:MAG: hypothetical protein LBK74_03025 [Treponema sp.]|jgi:hypothetical protein|nr:hypothetical protein [Treponema sp.]
MKEKPVRKGFAYQFTRRTKFRIGIAAAWILLGAVLFMTNRGHSLLVDNRDVDPHIRAPDRISVSVDGKEGVAFFRGDRDRFTVTGSKHRIRVEFSGGEAPFEGEFVLPVKEDMYLLSVPKMLAGTEPFVEVFRTAPEPVRAEEALPEADSDPFL